MLGLILNSIKSKTIWGIAIAALSLSPWGRDLIATFNVTEEGAALFASELVTYAGLAVAWYGRTVAKKPLNG